MAMLDVLWELVACPQRCHERTGARHGAPLRGAILTLSHDALMFARSQKISCSEPWKPRRIP